MYLLDTHTLVWVSPPPNNCPRACRRILRAEEVTASVVSYWELMLKKGRANALVIDPMPWWKRYMTRSSVEVLPVRVAHMDRLDTLAAIHRDPFDRMLVAQVLAEKCTLVTADATLSNRACRQFGSEPARLFEQPRPFPERRHERNGP